MGVVSIQIIEGNQHLRSLLSWHLQQASYQVFQSVDYDQAKDLFLVRQPRLVILSNDLPNGGGIEFCQWMQQQGQGLTMMLSAQSTEAEIVKGLRSGADDYLTKPFGMRELVARCRALLRRQHQFQPPSSTNNTHNSGSIVVPENFPKASPSLSYQDIGMYPEECRVIVRNVEINLSPKEYKILELFLRHPKRVWSRDQLLERVWGHDFIGDSKTVDVHIRWLREKLELDPSRPIHLVTVRGFGYRLG